MRKRIRRSTSMAGTRRQDGSAANVLMDARITPHDVDRRGIGADTARPRVPLWQRGNACASSPAPAEPVMAALRRR
jgi:hypothetical protein